jgi:hypothetical protein
MEHSRSYSALFIKKVKECFVVEDERVVKWY